MADPEDRLLAFGANPEMTAVQEVIDAVLLRRDRVIVRLADHLEALDVDLETGRRTLVGARDADDDDRCLLREVVGQLEQIVANRRPGHDRLNEAGAVAQDQEMDLAARSAIVQPPLDGDLFAFVPADVFDVDVHTLEF